MDAKYFSLSLILCGSSSNISGSFKPFKSGSIPGVAEIKRFVYFVLQHQRAVLLH